ncbi:3-ketoacyl-CoA thiolase, mitochondrial-like [Convolutriloba macropyga]|uniref:3-ketoacyl-CoA thiolase, mitochondrial-like n=1 Tax=Convolutriloba macropyga TaxID=536237 RepID=UPI003F52154F
MAARLKDIFIVGAKRTGFGKYGGTLANFSPTQLAVHSSVAAMKSANIKPENVDSVVVGNVIHSSPDGIYCARHVGLKAGVPLEREMYSINRLCGSGFQSVVNACQSISIGESHIVLAAGTESMSMAPYSIWNSRFGIPLGQSPKVQDALWSGLTDTHCNLPMALTAENLAEKYKISREDCDLYALQSQQRWAKAYENQLFADEICEMELKSKKGPNVFAADEYPRKDPTIEMMKKLKPVFKEGGTVTAGTASGVNDGAGTVMVASEEACKKFNLEPLARIVGYGAAGCDPSIMGIGPVPAIMKALTATSLTLNDMDLVEVNEAFAAQYLAVEKELGLNRDKTNSCGGAIAIGHPLAASGSRILAHLAYRVKNESDINHVVGSACIGGGQGIAVILSKP